MATPVTTRRERELETLARQVTWTIGANAVASLTFGLMLLAWPGPTLTVAATALGLWLLLDGATRVVLALTAKGRDPVAHGFRAAVGAALAVAGVVTIRHPGASPSVVVSLTGAGLLLGGLVEVIMAEVERAARWRTRIVLGVVAIVAGLAVLRWPEVTISLLATIAGAALTAIGAVQVVLTRSAGAALRSLHGPRA